MSPAASAAGTESGLWTSPDDGSTWQHTGTSPQRIDAVAFSPDFPADRTVFAGSNSGSGLLRSVDGGLSWQQMPPLPFAQITSLQAVAVAAGYQLLAGTSGGGVFKSSDQGVSWQAANSGLTAARVEQLAGSTAGIMAAGEGGLSLFPTDGTLWIDLPVPSSFITSVALDGTTVLAGTLDRGLIVSEDFGAHGAVLHSGAR